MKIFMSTASIDLILRIKGSKIIGKKSSCYDQACMVSIFSLNNFQGSWIIVMIKWMYHLEGISIVVGFNELFIRIKWHPEICKCCLPNV